MSSALRLRLAIRKAEKGDITGIQALGTEARRDPSLLPQVYPVLFKILAKNTPPSLAAASAALPIEEFAALSALQVALEEVCNIRKVHPSKPLFRPVIEQWPDIWKWLRFHFQHILSPYDGQGAIPGPHVMCDMEKHLTVLIAILGDISIADLSPDGTIDPFSASSDFIHTLVLIWAVNARRALRSPRDDELRKQIALLSVYPAGLLASSDRAEALLTELHALPDLSELFFGLMESFIPDLSSQAKGKHGAPDDSVLSLFAMIMHTLAQVGNGAHIGCSGTVGGSVPAVQMAFNPIAIRVFVLLMTWYPPEHCTKGDAHNIDRFRDAVDGCGAFTFALFDASLASRPVPYIKEGLDSGLLVLCRRLMLIRQCTCGTEICPWSKEVFPPQMASLYQQFIFDVTQHVAKAMMDGYTAIYRSMRTASKRNSRADYWIPGVTGNLQLGCGRGENGWDAFCDIVELSLKERRNFKKLGQSLCDNRQCPKAQTDPTKKCSGCGQVFYCTRECQRMDWLKVHHRECEARRIESQKFGFQVTPTNSDKEFATHLKSVIETYTYEWERQGKVPGNPLRMIMPSAWSKYVN